MMTLEFFRRRLRQLTDGDTVVGSGADAATATAGGADPADAARTLAALHAAVERTLDKTVEQALEQAAEGEHQLLRRAAQQRHDDTVPAAFYRTSAAD